MYKLMFDPEPISYKESRLEYFRAQKAHCERCLDYWVKALRKGKRGYTQIMLEDKCAEYGAMISYYEDAINAFVDVNNEHA